MPSFVPDPELNRLVRDLNRGDLEPEGQELERDEPVLIGRFSPSNDAGTGSQARLDALLRQIVALSGTALHLGSGSPAAFRVNGGIRFDPETVTSNDEGRVIGTERW